MMVMWLCLTLLAAYATAYPALEDDKWVTFPQAEDGKELVPGARSPGSRPGLFGLQGGLGLGPLQLNAGVGLGRKRRDSDSVLTRNRRRLGTGIGFNLGPVGAGLSAGIGHGNVGLSGGLGFGGSYSNYGSRPNYQQYYSTPARGAYFTPNQLVKRKRRHIGAGLGLQLGPIGAGLSTGLGNRGPGFNVGAGLGQYLQFGTPAHYKQYWARPATIPAN